jgi:flotillin
MEFPSRKIQLRISKTLWAKAQSRQATVAEEVKVERMRTQEMISVQEQEILRRQKELDATVIKPAEAAAIMRKAEAWKQFNEAAKLQTVLEKLPEILQASTGIFGAVAAPLGNIDKLVMIDQGAGSGDNNGGAGLTRLAKTSPTVVFSFLQQLEALGLNVPAVLQQLGVGAEGGKAAEPARVNGRPAPVESAAAGKETTNGSASSQ